MFDTIQDILLNTKFDNRDKFKQMVLETKARMETQVVSSGHSYAAGRIGARYMVSEFVEEKMRGIDTLEGMRKLAEEVESDWGSVLAKLERIRDLLVDRRNLIVNLSAEDKGFVAVQKHLATASQKFPK